jgi:molecular chaperone DnaK (HSP70)
VRRRLAAFFDREPNCEVSPEEAVAHGTAIQAAILTDRKKISVGATEAALHAHLTDVER